jgi:hypothetical protein
MPDPLVSPDLQSGGANPPSLAVLVKQSAWRDAVIAAARAQYKELPDSCPAVKFNPTDDLTLYQAPSFGADGKLASGVWTERVIATGCGAPLRLNVMTLIQPGQPPARIPTMPGDSHADPATQKNALDYAQAVAARFTQVTNPTCKHQVFTEADFDGYTGLPIADVPAGSANRAWRENWQLSACGTGYTVVLTFVPNARGMQLTATNPIKR